MSVDGSRADPQSAARNDARLPSAWHSQTEDEIAAAYEYGFLCGLRTASVAMERALHEAVCGVHYSAKQIIDSLIRAMDREVARSRYE